MVQIWSLRVAMGIGENMWRVESDEYTWLNSGEGCAASGCMDRLDMAWEGPVGQGRQTWWLLVEA